MRSAVARFYLRVCLFFPITLYAAIFWTDSLLLILLSLTSLAAVPLHFMWLRKRYGPFLAFLALLYVAQVVASLNILT